MSIDLSGLPIELALIVFGVVAVAYLAQGVIVEYTSRNTFLKDLEIVKNLRSLDSEKAVILADEYEEKAIKRIDRFVQGRTPIKFTLAALIRGVPVFWVVMLVWLISVAVSIQQGIFSLDELGRSFVLYLLAGLTVEGLFSVLKPWVRPLSERYGGVTKKFQDTQHDHVAAKPKNEKPEKD